MMRSRCAAVLGLAAVAAATSVATIACADDVPIMATYEMKKARDDARIAERNPRSFWIHQIVARITDKAPDAANPFKGQATVQLSFVVARDGHVVSKSVATPSGNEAADKLAMSMLERAAPFPPMPPGVSDPEVSFSVPIRFR